MIQTQAHRPVHHHAGPSTSSIASSSTSSSAAHAFLPAPSSPRTALPPQPTHVQAIHDFDPALLASTGNANPNMYLSFKAGEIVRVHVRDQTGWWDGEIAAAGLANREDTQEGSGKRGPRRGWFPSNYVREMGWDGTVMHARAESSSSAQRSSSRNDSLAEAHSIHSRHTSAISHHSRASTSTSVSSAAHSRTYSSSQQSHSRSISGQKENGVSPKHRSPTSLPPSLQALLHPIVQSLSLLESAIHSYRKPHIQPATACVISSIRSALQQTDCLSKESAVLTKHPGLAKERKIVLVELSKLVACARSASGLGEDDTIRDVAVEDEQAMDALAKAARGVFASVKRFLLLANDCGVEAVSVMDADQADSDSIPARPESRSRVRCPVPSNTRMQEVFKMKAASIGDLRAARRRDSSPPPPLPTSANLVTARSSLTSRARSPSITTPVSASFDSSSGRSSPISVSSARSRRIQGSIDNSFSHATTSSEHASAYGGIEEAMPRIHTPSPGLEKPQSQKLGALSDVSEAIAVAEDALLSIIAAFIGHIHSHQLQSHPSSHATLIEMTKETIDAVRELLTIVERVGRNVSIRMIRPREIESLRLAKDQLYDVANRLVEGAEAVANAPFSESGEEIYDRDKSRLLQSATGTLRAGTECVRLVRICVPDEENPISTPRQGDASVRQSTPRPIPEGALVKRENPVGARGDHTLSGLHRKATSLSNLQKRYQLDGGLVEAPKEEEEGREDEDDEEVVTDLSKDEDLTVVPTAGQNLIRPTLLHTHTSPMLPSSQQTPGGLLRTYSDGPTPVARSRSSSLTSPAPPRIQRRSPSRSADLDKFTSDFDIPIGRPQPVTLSATNRESLLTALSISSSSTTQTSTRSSMTSLQTTNPQTPTMEDSPVFEHLKPDASSLTSLGKVNLKINVDFDHDATPVKGQSQFLQSPWPPRPTATRSVTAPPARSPADARFWAVAHDYDPREIVLNNDGNMVGASLTVLVEKMTPHDGLVDQVFWKSFFYTFRLFSSPLDLANALISRYSLQPPGNVVLSDHDRAIWVERKVVPVRLRVYNLLKAWLDTFWRHDSDDIVLDTLRHFAEEVMMRTLPAMAPHLLVAIRKAAAGPTSAASDRSSTSSMHSTSLEVKHKRNQSSERLHLKSPLSLLSPMTATFNLTTPSVSTPLTSNFQHQGQITSASTLPPTPIISKSLHSLLQKNNLELSRVPLVEFDTLELARQLTIMEYRLFAAVEPGDLIYSLGRGQGRPVTLKNLSETSNRITGWVADGILGEMDQKKRAGLLKFYIKLADKCLTLNNFSSMWAILAGLNSSTILRLKKTWDALSAKYRLVMERLRGVIEHTKNHAAYRARLREVNAPCLPFLGLILTDITFTSDGNPDTRSSTLVPDLTLINYDKYAKLGKIAVEFGRYQQPFNFHELEAAQAYLRRALAERGSTSIDALYKKSLMLEPRQGSERVSVLIEKPGWLGGKI